MAIDLDETGELAALHFEDMVERSTELKWFDAAYRTEFWQSNPFTLDDRRTVIPVFDRTDANMPFKVETNMVWPFVAAHVSNLYYRAPRTRVAAPAVSSKPGRKSKNAEQAPRMLEGLLDEWLNRADIKSYTTYAYQMALLHGSSAFKMGVREGGRDIMSRLWVDVLPRWECMWDERSRGPDQELYRGHVRWERIDKARLLLGDELEDAHPVQLYDALDMLARGRQQERRAGPGRYVQILEFYDLEAEEQRFYLVEQDHQTVSLREVGKPLKFPYEMPDGGLGLPILPVILANVPHLPMAGIPAVRRIYRHNAETNWMLTMVANQMRRDGDRLMAYLQDKVDSDFLDGLKSGGDLRWLPVKGSTLENLWKAIESPAFAQSLPAYKQWIDDARKDAQGFSDIMTGRQGKYLTAQEASLLADAGESTATEIASRMAEALSRTLELFLTVLGTELSGTLEITKGTETLKVDAEMLKRQWTVTIVDAASTPVRDAQKKQEFTLIADRFLALVTTAASTPPEPGAAQPGGVPTAPPELKAAAIAMINYMGTLFQLPESLSWTSIALAAQGLEPEEDGEANGAGIDEDQARALMEKLMPHLGAATAAAQGGQPPTPGPPAGIPGQ